MLGDVLLSFDASLIPVRVAHALLGAAIILTFPLPFFATRSGCERLFNLAQSREWVHTSLAVCLVLLTGGAAVCTSKVEVVLGFKGALLGSPCVYVLPALFMYRLLSQDGASLSRKVGPITLLVWGVAAMIVGTVVTAMDQLPEPAEN